MALRMKRQGATRAALLAVESQSGLLEELEQAPRQPFEPARKRSGHESGMASRIGVIERQVRRNLRQLGPSVFEYIQGLLDQSGQAYKRKKQPTTGIEF